MIRYFILRIVVPLIVFMVLRAVLRSIFAGFQSDNQSRNRAQVPAGGELKKDPVCGTYVAAAAGITHQVKGQTFYFCSKECRDKYRAA